MQWFLMSTPLFSIMVTNYTHTQSYTVHTCMNNGNEYITLFQHAINNNLKACDYINFSMCDGWIMNNALVSYYAISSCV